MALVGFNIVFIPRRKADTPLAPEVLNAGGGINLDLAGFVSPTEQPSHDVEEMSGAARRRSARIAAGDDATLVDRGERLSTGSGENVLNQVLSLASGGGLEGGPIRRL